MGDGKGWVEGLTAVFWAGMVICSIIRELGDYCGHLGREEVAVDFEAEFEG